MPYNQTWLVMPINGLIQVTLLGLKGCQWTGTVEELVAQISQLPNLPTKEAIELGILLGQTTGN